MEFINYEREYKKTFDLYVIVEGIITSLSIFEYPRIITVSSLNLTHSKPFSSIPLSFIPQTTGRLEEFQLEAHSLG
jgi:hypothetical protein